MTEAATTTESAGAATESAGAATETATKPTETVEFWKTKAREQETRAKANADAAKRLKDIEDAAKSDSQKLTETATAAETRASAAERERDRLDVALEKGLTKAQAKRLVGETREELEADAAEMVKEIGGTKRSTSFDGGTRTTGKAAASPAQAFADFLGAQTQQT